MIASLENAPTGVPHYASGRRLPRVIRAFAERSLKFAHSRLFRPWLALSAAESPRARLGVETAAGHTENRS